MVIVPFLKSRIAYIAMFHNLVAVLQEMWSTLCR